MKISGDIKADALRVASINIDWLKDPIVVDALGGFINTKTGQTLGWTKGAGAVWSTATMEALQTLRERMEADLVTALFEGGPTDTTRRPDQDGEVKGGLAEHLEGTDAPSI